MASIEVTYDPITINSGPVTVDVNGLNDIGVTLSVPKPIETDTTLTLKTPDTLKTDTTLTLKTPDTFKTDFESKSAIDTKSAIDLQPVAIDQCLRLSLAPLPATRICYPNRQRISLSLFGVEVFGMALEGEAKVLVGEPQRQTHIVGGDTEAPRLKIRLGG